MSVVTIKNSELSVEIKSFGAEILSVKDSSGREYMWCGDPDVWEDRSPILFPIVSRLNNDKYSFGGKEYSMGAHGFAQNFEFEIEKADEQSVTFLLKSNVETLAMYPFEFEFRVIYTLDKNSLIVDFETKNLTDGNMYYSVGSHEGFATSGGIENYSIVLDEKETLARYEVLPSGVISGTPIPCIENSKELKLSEEYFKVDAIIFFDMKSKGLSLRDDRNGKEIHIDFPFADTVLIWKEPNAQFVCIEPWLGAPDLEWKRVDDFSKKYRIRTLEKGETEKVTHTVTF
jgi:galactose mutarotase-like enzyme